MTVIVIILVAFGLLSLWAARANRSHVDLYAWRFWVALVGSALIGMSVGAFYQLLDYPLVWP